MMPVFRVSVCMLIQFQICRWPNGVKGPRQRPDLMTAGPLIARSLDPFERGSATAHAVATVVTQITVAVSDRDGTTVVTTRRVALEPSELIRLATQRIRGRRERVVVGVNRRSARTVGDVVSPQVGRGRTVAVFARAVAVRTVGGGSVFRLRDARTAGQ